jgi:two-component system response regulator RegX3
MVGKEVLMASGREQILIVTANDGLAGALRNSFEEYGYTTEVVRDGTDAVEAIRRTPPTVLLVEHRADLDQLRRDPRFRALPIVAIQQPGARCAEDQCLEDLEVGADASLCELGYREIIARVRAILRREELLGITADRYVVGRLRLDTVRHEVTVDGKPVELTLKEFQILLQLMQHPARAFSRDELLDRVWGKGYALEQHTLDVHIHSLRHKIEQNPTRPKYILTVRGIGYKLSSQ